MRIVVLVHPGSHFIPGSHEVEPARHRTVTDGICEDLRTADGFVVVDGSFSDGMPGWFENEIRAALARAERAACPSLRIWGCDSGERPYAAWQPHGEGIAAISDSQITAAVRLSEFLLDRMAGQDPGPEVTEILVTGAWATRDDRSGCVNSVAGLLRERLPAVDVRVSENALYEEYMDEEPEDPGAAATPASEGGL